MVAQKRVHFRTHRSRVSVRASHEALTLAHSAREMRVLKRHGVGEREGELGADFSSIVMPTKKRCYGGKLDEPYLFVVA